ncbi:MAG: TolC family outer membrane protein [Caulobacterales bacterium]|nr:TolC family outer membrane protein [Caulobacterales bacterium]
MLRRALVSGAVGLAAWSASAPASGQTLQEALAAAYASNPTLLAERASARATDEEFYAARSGWLPSLSASASVSANDFEQTQTLGDFGGAGDFTTSDTRGTSTYEVRASQDLYRGGRTRADLEQARALISASRAGLVSVEQSILLTAVTAFMDVRRDEEVVEIRANNVAVLDRQLDAARDRFEVGEITRTDVAQAEARLAGARSELAAARAELAASRAEYENVIGSAPGSLEEAPPLPPLPGSVEEAVERAVDANPDVTAARFSEAQARAAVRGARGAFLPTLSLSATASKTDGYTTGATDSDSLTGSATLSVPILTGGLNSARVRQARQDEQRARLDVHAAERSVREGVAAAWSSYTAALSQIDSNREQVRANEIAFEGVEEEARVGLRTTLDVLDAEQELLDSRLALTNAERDAYIAAYALLQSVGGLTAQGLGLEVDVYDPATNLRVRPPR